jgi:dTDP-4-amino-4,6-dideoxygalactose transaminase
VTDDVSARIVRLPLWTDIDDETIERVSTSVLAGLSSVADPASWSLR